MSSGRVLLSVRGREDLPISGTPQYSYYLKNYTRSEPYEYLFVDNALATIVQGRTPTYGDTIAFEIPRRGDLLSKLFLKIVLPPSYLYSNLIRTKTDTFNLYSIIEFVDLEIGGQLVQRLTGEYILNYINLYYSSNDFDFFQNVTEMKIKDLRKSYSQFGQFVLLPIPFYFWDNKGNELPLISLTRQRVKVNLKLAPKPPITGLPELTDVTIATEYILLGSETTKKVFVNNGLTYRISQVQMNSEVISKSETKKIIDLNFQNPVREMFVCIQPRTYQDISNSKFYNYFGNYRNSFLNFRNPDTGWYLSEHHISGMSLRFNNNDYINEEGSGSAQMLSSALPQKYYANSDNIQQFRGYVYPFVIDPLTKNPQGHINMSRILKKQLTLYMNTSQLSRSVRVYASSYNIMMIRDGVSGLMFTNPSHYNPKIVLGESSEVVEGIPPTDMVTLSPDQGFYYAIKIDEGHEIVGIQFHTEDTPEFGGDLELHDDQFSYLLNTNDTFMSNVTPTDTSEYTPGTVSQLLQNVIEIPNEQDAGRADRYHITTSNNYIYTSNFGFVTNIRLAIKVHESIGSLGTGALTSYGGQYSNLLTAATFTIYKSSKFFDRGDINAWIADPSTISEVRNIRGQNTYESPGYYYSALAIVNASNDITDYSKIHFARTYNFSFSFSVLAPTTDDYSRDTNISSVSFKVSNLSGSGSVRVYLGSSERTSILFYNEGDIELDINFNEQLERGIKTYSVLISPDGSRNITKNFQLIAGGTAPPLYHAIQVLAPEGQAYSMSIRALQGYSPAPPFLQFASSKNIEDSNSTIDVTSMSHSAGTTLYSNHFSDVPNQVNLRYGKPVFRGPLELNEDLSDITAEALPSYSAFSMGTNDYIYSTSPVSITFYSIGVSYINSPVPDENCRVSLYSSSDPFGTPSIPDWINGTTIKTFTFSELERNNAYRYIFSYTNYNDNEFPKNTADFATSYNTNYNMITYYVPFDTTSPVMTITYAGGLKVDGDTITVERFAPAANFIDYLNDYTYINVQIDDETALITESNTISLDTVGTYSITFTATDSYYNSSTQTFTVELEDTQQPALVSNVITGAGLGLTLTVELNETSNIDLKQNGVVIQTYTDVTGFTKSITGLPEGILHTYTADTEDQYENTGTLFLGTYVPDLTEPELFLNNYSSTRIFTGATLFLERYSTFTDIEVTAFDNVDGDVSVAVGAGTPDTTERAGTQTIRTYTATDTAENSNVATITFEISDTVHPGLEILNDISVNESTREITISGTATEECSIYFYRDSARTQLVSNTETTTGNTFSNTFIESSDGMHKYYLSLYDSNNYTNTNSTNELYLSDYIYRFPYEGFSNTSVTVPAGTSNVYVFLWGGNGGTWLASQVQNRQYGGGGGFTESMISPVYPGTQITVNVGEGGITTEGVNNPFGGGGSSNNYTSVFHYAGAGGGATNVIYDNTVTLAVSGGGGGAAPNRFSAGGGYGGGGLVGNSDITGTGGTQTAGGKAVLVPPGEGDTTYIGDDGSQFIGGDSNAYTSGAISGGGGGGGWYGGAAGTSSTYFQTASGGGGGSSWLGEVLSHSSNEWGTSTTFEDTSGRSASGFTYTNSKILRGPNDQLTKPQQTHYFWTGSWQNGYAVIMFT